METPLADALPWLHTHAHTHSHTSGGECLPPTVWRADLGALDFRCQMREQSSRCVRVEFNEGGYSSVLHCSKARVTSSVVIRLPRVTVHLKMGDAGEVSVVLRNVVAAAIKSIFYGTLLAGLCVCKGLAA